MDLLSLHQMLYERTDGRIGHRLIGVPPLLLRTTGRKTGQQRTSALGYARDGKDEPDGSAGIDSGPGWGLDGSLPFIRAPGNGYLCQVINRRMLRVCPGYPAISGVGSG